jgi:hypothetical protein
LRDVNHLIQGQELQIGQQMHLIFTKVSPAEFHRFRLEYHKSIQEDFFSHFTSNRQRYKVNSGDNLWQLCSANSDPTLAAAAHNPESILHASSRRFVRCALTRPRTAHPAALNLRNMRRRHQTAAIALVVSFLLLCSCHTSGSQRSGSFERNEIR